MEQNVKINGWKKRVVKMDSEGASFHTVNKIWCSPDKTKAVLEIFRSELYVAVSVEKEEDGCLFCKYVDHFAYYDWDTNFRVFEGVDWSYLEYGFCKLRSWSFDTGELYAKRFYFDRQLYLKKYREKTGKPKMRNGKEVTD